jgi:RNA polymerase sigma-70 factor (ECF subfamily)
MVRNEVQDSKRRSASRARREARALLASDFESVVNPESSVDVRRAIAQLSSRQRAVVFLYFWNDSSESEIAELLGIRPGSVRRHLSRARSHLRRTLR